MAIDFEWNGNRWEAKQVRRRFTQHEHRGVAYYDLERMRQPLAPIVHPHGVYGYSTAPSWAEIPESWGRWDTMTAGYFHHGGIHGSQPVDDLDAPSLAQTADYKLERCHFEAVCSYRNPERHRPGQPEIIRRRAVHRWELTFADGAMFRFVSRAIAETALSELLKIRKAKHPRARFTKLSPENECVFFTERKLRTLAADASHTNQSIGAVPVDTAA